MRTRYFKDIFVGYEPVDDKPDFSYKRRHKGESFYYVCRHDKYLDLSSCNPLLDIYYKWAESLGYGRNIVDVMNTKTCDLYSLYSDPIRLRKDIPQSEVSEVVRLRELYISGLLAAIDLIEVAGLNPQEEVFQPSTIGASVAKIWLEVDPETYHEIMKLNGLKPDHFDHYLRDIKSIESGEIEDKKAIARTWLASCKLDSLYCAAPKFLPNIFATDQREVKKFGRQIEFADGTLTPLVGECFEFNVENGVLERFVPDRQPSLVIEIPGVSLTELHRTFTGNISNDEYDPEYLREVLVSASEFDDDQRLTHTMSRENLDYGLINFQGGG